MGKYNIVVYGICKNEEKNIKRFVNACKDADQIIFLDTGSTDNTVQLLREAGVTVYQERINPWRWDVARNKILSYLPNDVDFCFSLDLDETPSPDWREKLEDILDQGVESIQCTLVDKFNQLSSYRHRIHKRHGWYWTKPIHEVCIPDSDREYNYINTDLILIYHHKKENTNYIDYLTQYIQESPTPDLYIQRGSDYLSVGEYNKALSDYKQYLKLTYNDNVSQNTRSFAYISIAQIYKKIDRPLEEIFNILLKSVSEDPNSREAWTYLADVCILMNNQPLAYASSMMALNITESNNIKMDIVWGDYPKNIAAQSLGKILERIKNS